MREAASIIENDLPSTVTEGLTSVQHVDSYNMGFTSLRDRFCPLITKEMRVRDDAEWCPCSGSGEEVEKDRVRCRLYLYMYLLAGQ